MDTQLRRILDLVRKTGDRMVVTDANGEDVYVVMGLEQYEDLVNVASPEDDDRLDDDFWNGYTGLDNPKDGPSAGPSDIWEAMRPAGEPGETWDMGKMTDAEKFDLERQFEEYQKQKEAPAEAKEEIRKSEAQEEKQAKTDEDFGEEQFYLEPVE